MNFRQMIIALVSNLKFNINDVTKASAEAFAEAFIGRISEPYIDKFFEYLKGFQIKNLLSEDKLKEMHISDEHINFVIKELEDFLSKNPITEKYVLECNNDGEKLGEYLWKLYVSNRSNSNRYDYLEYDSDIKKVLRAYAKQWLQHVYKGEELLLEIECDTNATVKDMKEELENYFQYRKKIDENIYVKIDKILTDLSTAKDHDEVEEQKKIKGFYHINQDFMREISSSSHSIESKVQYYRLSGTIKNILDVVSQEQVVEYDVLVDSIISGINREIVIGEEESISTRVFFVTGEGGMGKTTFLVMAALKIARNTDMNVYMMQIKANESKERIEKIIETIDRKEKVLLFVDNPYDDTDATRRLLGYVNESRNIHIVLSERANRLELIFENSDLAFISNIAGALVIVNAEPGQKKRKEERDIKFVRSENIHYFCLEKSWKQEVIQKMVSYVLPKGVKLEDETLQNVLKEANYRAALCEVFLRICMKYNQIVGNDSIDVGNTLFKFDWTEWENLFASDNGFEPIAGNLGIQKVFPFIAALGLYKIPVTIEFISHLIGVNKFALKDCFDRKLRRTEPVRYDGETLTLKHDIIADLFFLANKEKKPQFYLMSSIEHLDEVMAIPFERYALSTKIIRGLKQIPHDQIDTVKLLEEFEKRPELLEYLNKHGRFHSYKYAKLYAMIQSRNISEEIFQRECEDIFENTPSEKKLQLSVWGNCFTASMETNFFPPELFFQYVEYLDYRVVTDNMSNFENYVKNSGYEIKHYRRIARKTFEAVMAANPEDIPSRLALSKIMIAQCAYDDAERILKETKDLQTEERYKAYIAYASLCSMRYRNIDKQIRKLKEWKKKHPRIDNEKSREQVFEKEQEEFDLVLPSETEFNMERAETEKVTVEKKEGKKSKLSVLCKKRKFYFESADTYYRLAVETDKGGKDERALCALAAFLSRSAKEESSAAEKAKRMRAAEEYFLEALKIGGNDSSAYNGLAMMYGNPAKWNPVYSLENAEIYFEKAIQNCPEDFMVTRYIPWGNINYNMGRLDIARQKYQLALQYKPDEMNAIKGLELIKKEEEEFALLLKETPLQVTSFESLYFWKKTKMYSKEKQGKKRSKAKAVRILNRKLFQKEATQREIFLLVYQTLLAEDLTLDSLKKCKLVMKKLSTEGGISIRSNFQYLRIAQLLQRRCEQLHADPYLSQQEARACVFYALKHYIWNRYYGPFSR